MTASNWRRMARTALVVVAFFVVQPLVAIDVGDVLFVHVRETELRSGPGFLSPIEERLSFGSELHYAGERSAWMQVTVVQTGISGWVHATAAKEDRSTQIQLQGEGTTRTVTSREVALAGRGFSENLEDEYRDQNEIDFSRVDELEAQQVDPAEIVSFVTEARLREDFLSEAE